MRRRWLPLLLALAAAAAAAASVSSQAPAAAPSRGRSTGAWTPPLGPDGHPDLQGVWLNNSATPLERPKAARRRASLTDEEVAELRRRADRLFKNTNADFAAGDAVYLAALAEYRSLQEHDLDRQHLRDDRAGVRQSHVAHRRSA